MAGFTKWDKRNMAERDRPSLLAERKGRYAVAEEYKQIIKQGNKERARRILRRAEIASVDFQARFFLIDDLLRLKLVTPKGVSHYLDAMLKLLEHMDGNYRIKLLPQLQSIVEFENEEAERLIDAVEDIVRKTEDFVFQTSHLRHRSRQNSPQPHK